MLRTSAGIAAGLSGLLLATGIAAADDDLLDNASSTEPGATSPIIQTIDGTTNEWSVAYRFDATEDGDVDTITVRMTVNSAQQNAATSKVSLQILANDSSNELGSSLATFNYDSHTQVRSDGSSDVVVDTTFTGTASLTANTYWLGVYSSGDKNTYDEDSKLPYSSLSNQTYEGPWRWVSGEQNYFREWYSTPSYSTITYAPNVIMIGTRTNPPADPTPDPGSNAPSTPQVTVALILADGLLCVSDPDTNPADMWIALPRADQCALSGRSTDSEGSTLLGWATADDFPVDIAQRQVDNGWGAYQLDRGPGVPATVFIPAGGSAQITGDARFYPVFAN